MNFDLITDGVEIDENDNVVDTLITTPCRAELTDGVLIVYIIFEDGTETRRVLQPHKFVAGVATPWESLEEGVAWFKEAHDHKGA